MTSAKALFSLILVGVLSTACQKESKKSVTAPKPSANRPNPTGAGADPTLNLKAAGNNGPSNIPATVQGDRTEGVTGEDGITGSSRIPKYPEVTGFEAPENMPFNSYDAVPGASAPASSQAAVAPSSAPVAATSAPNAVEPLSGPADDASSATSSETIAAAANPPAAQSAPVAPAAPADPNEQVLANAEQLAANAGNDLQPTKDPNNYQYDVVSPTKFTAVETENPKWTPGLPHSPAKEPIYTGGSRAGTAAYTDSKFDSIMAVLWQAFNSDAALLKKNEEMAPTITNVHLVTLDGQKYTLAVELAEDGNRPQLVFQGARESAKMRPSKKTGQLKKVQPRTFEMTLQPQSAGKPALKYRYHAHVICSDLQSASCENASIEVGRFDLNAPAGSAEPIAKAFIVHRLGQAVMTFKTNEGTALAHKKFNRLLTQKIEKAKIRAWHVAGGGSKLEFILPDASDPSDVYFKKSLMFKGELVLASEQAPEKLEVKDLSGQKRDAWFSDVVLLNNDGGGNLNLKLTFANSQEEKRISVSSNFNISKPPKFPNKAENEQKPIVTSDATPTEPAR